MTVFGIVAALLAAGALAFVLPPLLRVRAGASRPSRSAVNADLYRAQLAELERERAAGTLSEPQYRESRLEIERRVLEDVAPADSPAAGRPPRRAALAVGVLVPLAAALLYAGLGNFGALDPRAAREQAGGSHDVTPEQIVAMVERLAARLKDRPDDVEGWSMLARSLGALGRHEESARAYAHLAKLLPNDAGVLADYADMLAMAQGRRLEGEPYALVKRALAIDPNHIKSLALAGSAEFELKNFAGAAKYWERILALVPADSEFAGSVRGSIAEAREAGGLPAAKAKAPAATAKAPAGAAITGVVKISPQLKGKVSPEDTLFVFARPAEGGRMPLAIVRAKARELPYKFRLDDSQAMAPGMQLSSQGRVVVGARISKSGNATPQPGDLQVASAPVTPGTSGLEIVIDQVVR